MPSFVKIISRESQRGTCSTSHLLDVPSSGMASFTLCQLLEKNLNLIIWNWTTILFWQDNWVDGHAPAELWPHLFQLTIFKERSIKEFASRNPEIPLNDFPTLNNFFNIILAQPLHEIDERRWTLIANWRFSVKSFYNFLNDGGLRCSRLPITWNVVAQNKINLFNLLSCDNKILTLET